MPTTSVPTWDDTVEEAPSWDDTIGEDEGFEEPQTLGSILAKPSFEVPYQPGMQTPGVFAPTTTEMENRPITEGLQEGVLRTAGVTPEIIPSGAVEAPGLAKVPAALGTSVARTGIGIADYLTSPQGVTELVLSMSPARLLVLGKWATDMAKGAGQETGELSTLLRKPNKTPEDWQEISDRTVNTLALTFGAGSTARGPFKAVRSIAEPKTMGAVRQLSEMLETVEPSSFTRPRTPIRQLGIPQPTLSAEPFLQPGVRELSGEALREAQGPVVIPGELSSLEQLRREIQPPQLTEIDPTRVAIRLPEGGEAPYGKTSFMREAEAPTTTRTQKVTAQEKELLQSIVNEEVAKGAVFEQRNLPEGVKYRRPKEAPTLEEYERQRRREDIEAGLVDESGQYLDEPTREMLPEITPEPQRAREGVSVIDPRTGRAIEKPIPLSALQRSRLRAALSRGASEQTIKNILRLEAPENPQAIKPAPPVREMRPIEPWRGEEINAPTVEDVRAQRELERRQNAIQQETTPSVRDVRQREVQKEVAPEVPAEVSRPKAPETRVADADLSVIVQSPQKLGTEMMKGYVQVDSMRGGKNEWSSNPDALVAGGYDVPATWMLQTLPQGKYTMPQAKQMLKEKATAELKPAVLINGKPVTGESHIKIALKEGTPEAIQAMGKYENQGFVYADRFISREAASKLIGEKDPLTSERLYEIRGKKAEPVEQPKPTTEAARDWDLFEENLIDNLDAFAPARDTGVRQYDLSDVASRFVQFAKADKSGKSLDKLVGDFAKQDIKSLPSQIKKIRESVKSVVESESPATDIISKLESLKLPEAGEGRLYSLPHPDAIKAIGRSTWNSAVDVAIASVKAGKAIKEAVDDAIAYLKRQGKQFDETQARANMEYQAQAETAQPAKAAPSRETTATPVDPITGEPAKMITEKAAKAMESKVKLPAEKDVATLTEQINLFNKEIGDALESGGRFLPKELRPDVAKGAPAERGTVTNKDINQYFVNKLSSIRKQIQAAKQKISQQADVESQVYFKLLQDRFEQAFRQVQELRRASHESLFFWNKIKAEYQEIARAAGEMPEMKRQLPILDQIVKDMRDKNYRQAGSHLVDYLRMNLFTLGSWTLDFGTNLVASGAKVPAWAIMDMGSMVAGKPATRMFSAMRALADNTKNWNPLGKRFRLNDRIEAELGNTAGGEFGGKGREVIVDFSEILKSRPELADKLRHIDKVIGAPVRMKRAVDGFFGRFGATAELYHRAYVEGKSRGLRGDDLKKFAEDFVQNPSDAAVAQAVKTGKELKFNRDLTKFEEAFASNIMTKLVVEAFPRWTLQFVRWAGEMTGIDPVFFKDVVTGKATGEQTVNYLTKAATGWGGIYAFNQLFYDNIDANSMEYVKEDGNRVRLAGRTPAAELFFISALLRGDTEKAKSALQHLSVPGAKLLSGEPAGLISPLVDTIRESIRGRYTTEMTIRELTKIVNDAIPGKSVLGLIRSLYDPTVREGIGAPVPGVAQALPQRVNPTTGEPLSPRQRIPGTGIEIPTVGGVPFPGAERVLNDVESALLDHGLGITRPRRTSIIDLPPEDVPKEIRREYEKAAGKYVQELIGAELQEPDFKELPFEVRREVLQQLLTAARTIAKNEMADKYGAEGASVKSTPLNIQRLPKRLTQ